MDAVWSELPAATSMGNGSWELWTAIRPCSRLQSLCCETLGSVRIEASLKPCSSVRAKLTLQQGSPLNDFQEPAKPEPFKLPELLKIAKAWKMTAAQIEAQGSRCNCNWKTKTTAPKKKESKPAKLPISKRIFKKLEKEKEKSRIRLDSREIWTRQGLDDGRTNRAGTMIEKLIGKLLECYMSPHWNAVGPSCKKSKNAKAKSEDAPLVRKRMNLVTT